MRRAVFLAGVLVLSNAAFSWTAEDRIDPISGKMVYGVSAKSRNSVDLDFPFGKIRAKLEIQAHPVFGRRAAILMTGGIASCSVTVPCELLIRFDEGSPQRFDGVVPDSGANDVLLVRQYVKFIALLKKSKSAYIAIPFYKQGIEVFEFSVKDFSDAMLRPVK